MHFQRASQMIFMSAVVSILKVQCLLEYQQAICYIILVHKYKNLHLITILSHSWISFLLRFYLFTFRESRREGEREGKKY